jgi:hypothetical protein
MKFILREKFHVTVQIGRCLRNQISVFLFLFFFCFYSNVMHVSMADGSDVNIQYFVDMYKLIFNLKLI